MLASLISSINHDQQIPKQIPHRIRPVAVLELRGHGIIFCNHLHPKPRHYFGDVTNGEMHLNEIGLLTELEWLKTVSLRPDMNLELGNFVVMPNHFHGIIIIGDNEYNRDGADNGDADNGRDAMHGVSTNAITSTTPITSITSSPSNPEPPANRFGPQSKNLASIIRGFKSSVTIQARVFNPGFTWQPRFHDHIIRDADAFEKIQQYIANNPINWKEDKFYS